VNRSIQAFAFAIILLGLTATRARAGAIITLDDVTVAPGGMGTMDITITSNSGDTLSLFSLALQITQMPGTTSYLEFTGGVDPPYSNSNYVFSNQSFNLDFGQPFWGPPFTTVYTYDSISGGDSADPAVGPGYVTITGTLLLATVQFQALGTNPGDQFQISLVPPTYDLSNVSTQFDDQTGALFNYTSTGGTVTIASAIPEPSSWTLLALSGLSGLLWCCWRGRKHGLLKNSPVATPFPPTDPAVLP